MKYLALFFALVTSAYGFDLKGIEVGAPASDAQIQHALGVSCSGEGICAGPVSLAGVSSTVAIQRRDGAVVRMLAEFPGGGFEQISSALTGKFGKPKVAHGVNVTLAFCQGDADTVLTWQNAAGDEIMLFRYVDSRGKLLMRSRPQVDLETAHARKNAGDI